MKRNDIAVGTEYAVLSPSALANVDSGSSYSPSVKRVVALDARPIFTSSTYRSWRSNSNDKRVTVSAGVHGKVAATDWSYKSEGSPDSKRALKVVVVHEPRPYGDEAGSLTFTVETVPLSQVAMTWSEFITRRAAAKVARDRQFAAREARYEAEQAARKAALARRDAVNEVLAGTSLVAKLLDGEVVISGTPGDIDFAARTLAGKR